MADTPDEGDAHRPTPDVIVEVSNPDHVVMERVAVLARGRT